MADGKKKGGQKQSDKKKGSSVAAQQVKAQAAARLSKPQPKPAPPKTKPQPKPAAKPARKNYQIIPPENLPAPVFSSPLNIVLLLAGAALLIGGAVIFAKIQYGGGATKDFFLGTALIIAGVLLPCIGIPRLRNLFIPKKTIDQYDINTPDGKKS